MLARPFPRWFDFAALGVALMILSQVWGGLSVQDPAPVHIAAPQTHVALYAEAPAADDTLVAWAEWLDEADYFGAFAVARDGSGDWGMANRYNDEALARSDALTRCEASGAPCRLVAVSRAAGRMPVAGLSLRGDNLTAFGDYLSLDGARAFAISDRGATGWSWGHVFETGARASAIAACTAQLGSDTPSQLPSAPCRVIDSRHALTALREKLR